MIQIHTSGRVVRDPEEKVSKAGKNYVQALLVASSGDSEQLVTVMVFDEALQALLATLKKGDSLSAMGTGSFRAYTDRDGNPATGITVMVNRLMALVEAKSPPKTTRLEVQRPPQERGYLESLAAAGLPADTHEPDDDIPF